MRSKTRPTARPRSSELVADLTRHLNDVPVLAGPPTVSYHLRKSVRRKRGWSPRWHWS